MTGEFMNEDLETQWGVLLSREEETVVTVLVDDRDAAQLYQRENGGIVVHRQVGPWVEWDGKEDDGAAA